MKQVKLIIIEYFKISKILSFQHVINIFKLLVRLFYISFCTMSLKAGVYFFLLIDLRERERERDKDLLLHLLMHSLVYSRMCPDWGSNPQHWGISMTLTN